MNVAIVGNGAGVLNQENGEFIDSCDRVVRINKFIIDGYEDFTGRRLDIYCSKWHKIIHRTQDFIDRHAEFWFPHPVVPTTWGAPGGVGVIGCAEHKKYMDQFNICDNQVRFASSDTCEYLDMNFHNTIPSIGMVAITMTEEFFPSADIFIVGFDGMTNGWYWDQDHDCTENCRNSLIMEKIFYKKIVSKHNIYEL